MVFKGCLREPTQCRLCLRGHCLSLFRLWHEALEPQPQISQLTKAKWMSSNCCQRMSTQSLRGIRDNELMPMQLTPSAGEPTPGAKDVLWSSPLYLLVCIQRWGEKKTLLICYKAMDIAHLVRWFMMIYHQKWWFFPALACPDQVAVFDMHEDVCARSNVLKAARQVVWSFRRDPPWCPADGTLTLINCGNKPWLDLYLHTWKYYNID